MSTHSLIIVKTREDTFKSVYVHNAGDIEAQGRVIHDNYNDYAKALEIVAKGNISRLTFDLNDTRFYDGEYTFESKTLSDASLNHPWGSQEMTYFHDGKSWHVCADYPCDILGVGAGEMITLKRAIDTLDSKMNKGNSPPIEGEFYRADESPVLSGVKRLGQDDIESWRTNNPAVNGFTNTLKSPGN